MTLLLLKVTITPAVIALATIAARRFGPAVGGWLIGLPFTAGPVALFLALEHGPAFTSRVASGLVAGVSAEAAFVFGYVAVAARRRDWLPALAAGTVSFAAAAAALDVVAPPVAVLTASALALLLLGLRVVPRGEVRVPRPSRFELPVRMALATSLVVAVTAFASALGPGLSGIVTTFPLISTLLAVSVHRAAGPAAAVAVYRGLLAGVYALTGFAATLVLVLSRLPVAGAFAVALALTLSIQLGSLRVVRRSSVATT
jgi:hypothetical protein